MDQKTPAAAFAAREKARPTGPLVDVGGRRLRLDKVDKTGVVTLRHRGRLHHIGIGAVYRGWRVAMLVEGTDIEIVTLDGSPIRRLVLDPTKDSAPALRGQLRSTMSRDITWWSRPPRKRTAGPP